MNIRGATQESLDSTQYTTPSILQYELIYGEDFVSPGGKGMATELISQLSLPPKSRVLDAGCGLGGGAFVMAQQFDLVVDGIDLSKNMLVTAKAKREKHGLVEQVSLDHGDCLELDRPNHYDGIYSRDVFLHIGDKARLFTVSNICLRENGKLLFTDYCCGEKPWSDEFSAYVNSRGYFLHTITEYGDLISAAGFQQVVCEDVSTKFIEVLAEDIRRISKLSIEPSAQKSLKKTGWLNWRGLNAVITDGVCLPH